MSKNTGLPNSLNFKHNYHFVDDISDRNRTTVIRKIPIHKIKENVFQPRKEFGDLSELAQSIKDKGILEPILVRAKNGNYEIIAGERRFRAAKVVGLKEVPCIEHDVADNEALEISIIENIHRQDLSVIEEAFSYKSLGELYGYTHKEIAEKTGRSRVTVTEMITITQLPESIISRCNEMNIKSKTFLQELVKFKNIDEMNRILDDYLKKPFSRDKVKEERDRKNKKDNKQKNNIKFNILSQDKSIKIQLNIKKSEYDKVKVIDILESLIKKIKENGLEKSK